MALESVTHRLFGRFAGRATELVLVTAAALVLVTTLVKVAYTMRQLDDAGYGDSYILYDVHRYVATGTIYKSLSDPPYNATVYGPLLYWVLGKTTAVGGADSPFFGSRLAVFGAWVGCVLLAGHLSAVLVQRRGAFAWGALLAACMPAVRPWIPQIRADFFGIFFALLAIALLYRNRGWSDWGAACCAGLAIVFKMTLMAAFAAGLLWLLARRDYRRARRFACGAAAATGIIFWWFWRTEPRMFTQMLALRPLAPDLSGALDVIREASTQPVLLLALASLPWVLTRALHRWSLALVFLGVSLAIAAATSLHPGGNINYFFEGLWGAVPLATLAVVTVFEALRRQFLADLGLAAAIAVCLLVPASLEAGTIRRSIGKIEWRNRELRAVEGVLRTRRVASTVPRLALMTVAPPVTDPYFVGMQLKAGGDSYTRLFDQLRRGEFELVVTGRSGGQWRGIEHVSPALRAAISTAYRPYCVYGRALFHVRRQADQGSTLAAELRAIGCRPVVLAHADSVVSWWSLP